MPGRVAPRRPCPRRLRLAGALLACLLLTAACDPPAVQAPSNPLASPTVTPDEDGSEAPVVGVTGGTFRYGIDEPTAIVPPLMQGLDDRAVVDALFDSLTDTDLAGGPVPAAAVAWGQANDSRIWTFRLRPDATFHDGSPVTADAFVSAWNALVAGGPMAHLLRDVVGFDQVVAGELPTLSGLTAVDPLTLEVRLVTPRADLPVVLSHPALGPVQPEAWAADPMAYGDQPVGNGPFMASEPWAHGEFIRAARWPGWRNGTRPDDGIGEVVFRIADIDFNFLAFRQGRRDLSPVPPEALELAAEEYPASGGPYNGPGLVTGPRPVAYVLGINPAVPPYTDVEVRRAVSLLVDRQRIAAENESGNLDPALSLLPGPLSPESVGSCERCTFNPTGAGLRLERAGVDTLTFDFNAGGGHERVRDALRDALVSQGALLISNGRGVPPTFEDYLARLATGRIGMFRLTLAADVPSTFDVLFPLLHSSQTPANGGLNAMHIDIPQIDALLEQAATITDQASREQLLRRVEGLVVNRDAVVVPVVTYRHAVVIADTVTSMRYDAFGDTDLEQLRLRASVDGG